MVYYLRLIDSQNNNKMIAAKQAVELSEPPAKGMIIEVKGKHYHVNESRKLPNETTLILMVTETDFLISNKEVYQTWKEFVTGKELDSKDLWHELVKWAKIMEEGVKKGLSVVNIARKAFLETRLHDSQKNLWLIGILYQCWLHGPELKKVPLYEPYCAEPRKKRK